VTTTPLDRSFDDLRKTLGDYTLILRLRWRIALLTLGVVGTVAFWYSQYLPREYAATTTFERRDDVVLQQLVRGNSPYSFAHLKTSMQRDMVGPRALGEAAIAVGLLPESSIASTSGALPEPERSAVDRTLRDYALRTQVKMHNSSDSLDVVELRCLANDPEIARRFTIALRDAYIKRSQLSITAVLKRTRDFFESEVKRYQDEVSKATARLNVNATDFPGIDLRNPATVGARLESLRGDRDRIVEQVSGLSAEIEAREQFLRSLPEAYAAKLQETAQVEPATAKPSEIRLNTRFDRLIEQVEMQIADALTVGRMTPEHPAVRALELKRDMFIGARDELRVLMLAELNNSPAATPASTSLPSNWEAQQMRVQMELSALQSQHASAKRSLIDAEERYNKFTTLFDDLVSQTGELQQVEASLSEYTAAATVWQSHLAQLERILAAQSEERGTQFTLLDEATATGRPIKPSMGAIFFVCLGVGLAAAAIVVALAELLDRSFRSVPQLSRSLNIPVLECIGVIDTPKERRRRRRMKMLWTPALAIVLFTLAVTMTLAHLSLYKPKLHARVIGKLEQVASSVGAPLLQVMPPSLHRASED
jgi:uncharacterized protein involved in exopolysaccharide biosynthesis